MILTFTRTFHMVRGDQSAYSLPGWCLMLSSDPIFDLTCFKSGPLATPTAALIGGISVSMRVRDRVCVCCAVHGERSVIVAFVHVNERR